jgi:hypothetical protein
VPRSTVDYLKTTLNWRALRPVVAVVEPETLQPLALLSDDRHCPFFSSRNRGLLLAVLLPVRKLSHGVKG